jgi:hypothetical protein
VVVAVNVIRNQRSPNRSRPWRPDDQTVAPVARMWADADLCEEHQSTLKHVAPTVGKRVSRTPNQAPRDRQ